MKILLTGATGFVGRHLLGALLDRHGEDTELSIFCLVRKAGRLADGAHPAVSELEMSDAWWQALAARVMDVSQVYHVAGLARLGDGPEYESANVELTTRVLQLAARAPSLERFVFVSSVAAADRAPEDPCAAPLREDMPDHPMSDYGRSKLAAEELVKTSGLPFVIVRPPLVYGAHMRPDSHLFFLLQGIVDGKLSTRVRFPGRVSTVHVRDLARALIFVAGHREAVGRTFYVDDGARLPLGTLLKILRRLTADPSALLPFPGRPPQALWRLRRRLPLKLQGVIWDVLTVSSRAIRELGFGTEIDPLDGLPEMVRDFHWRRQADAAPRRCVVTGGASGLGRSLVRVFRALGWSVCVVDRDEEALASLQWLDGVEVRLCDLSDEAAVSELAQSLAPETDCLINNAGIGLRTDHHRISADAARRILAVNCTAPAILSARMAQRWIAAGRGGLLIQISSSAALQPLPFMAVYAASKSFLSRMSQAVAAEWADRRIRVHTIVPGGMATDFQAHSGVARSARETLLDPLDVAARIASRIDAPSGSYAVGNRARAMDLLARLLPITAQARLWRALMGKLR